MLLLKSLNKLCDFLYPRHCVECNQSIKEEALFCTECAKGVRLLSGPVCPVCGAPFASEAALSHSPSHRCGDCRETPPSFSNAITPFLYEGPLATAICKFKYEKQPHLATSLASLLIDNVASFIADRVIPIPLYPSRLRSREFNQSLLLAQKIAKKLACPFSVEAMRRIRETLPQVGLSKREREENIKGAFRVVFPKEVEGQRILLIDDVYTTGATLREGARVLMQAGAKEVIAVAIARMAKSQLPFA